MTDLRLFLLGQGSVLISHRRHRPRGDISLVAMVFAAFEKVNSTPSNSPCGVLFRVANSAVQKSRKAHENGRVKSSTLPAGAKWPRPAPELIKTKDRALLMLMQPPGRRRSAGRAW